MNQAHLILKAEFEKRKERNPNFSLRSFAKWLAISPAQLSQMMSGKRTITKKSLEKIIQRLDLTPIEESEFVNSLSSREKFKGDKKEISRNLLDEDRFFLISDWYHFAILSLTRVPGAKSDPRWIARRLGIQVAEASEAIMRLTRMNLLEVKPKFRQIGEPIEVLSSIPSKAIQKYHLQILSLAQEKLETIAVEKREFQSVVMAMDSNSLGVYKRHIHDFLDLTIKQANKDVAKNKGDQVYQMSIQLFPLSSLEKNIFNSGKKEKSK